MGSLPADSEQFMLIEYMDGQITKMQAQVDAMMHNKVNIMRLQEDMKEARKNIEKLKDKLREANGGWNGNSPINVYWGRSQRTRAIW